MEFEGTSETNGVAAIFRGIDGGVAEFVVDRNTLQDPTGVVGTMAHEVAHVFRCFHGLEVDDHDEEERLTDLTCVYLGYGVLSANASYRYRSSGWMSGGAVYTQWSHSASGYLSPQLVSFALAAQALSRARRSEARKLAKHLESNQAAYFSRALKLLDKDRTGLLRKLGVNVVAVAPPAPDLARLTMPIPDPRPELAEPDPPMPASLAEKQKRPNTIALRLEVRRSRALLGAILGMFGGIALSVVTAEPLPLFAAPFVGALIGQRLKYLHQSCTTSWCRKQLQTTEVECSYCGAQLVGTIARYEDRLEAEDEWKRSQWLRLASSRSSDTKRGESNTQDS